MDYKKNHIEVRSEKEIQKLLLYMLKELHDFCEKNNLIYNVFGGTFLGAVRHQGMIPWDDDIDVTMPRGDYERLIELIRSGTDQQFKIACYPDKDYCYPFAKLELTGTMLIENTIDKYNKHALYIDVFPVDGYPQKLEDIYFFKLKLLKKMRGRLLYYPKKEHGIKGKIRYIIKNIWFQICNILGIDYFLEKENKLALKYKFEDVDTVLLQGAGWNQKGWMQKKTYLNRSLYKFADFEVWGIRNYDEHLSRLYGDYMTLPPADKRVSNHDYKLYVNKDLYQQVIKGEKS